MGPKVQAIEVSRDAARVHAPERPPGLVALVAFIGLATAFAIVPGSGPALAQANASVAGSHADAGGESGSSQNLDELLLRQGAKPWNRLYDGTAFASERTVFFDTLTGAEIWRLTDDPREDSHDYYDIPVWNSYGSAMILLRLNDVVPNRLWVMAPDGSRSGPVAGFTVAHLIDPDLPIETASGDNFWSWADPNYLYGEQNGKVYVIDPFDFTQSVIFDMMEVDWLNQDPTMPILESDDFTLVPPHPLDDRLLFHTSTKGRLFALDLAADPEPLLEEIPNDLRWYVPPELGETVTIHRLRWTKANDGHKLFIGQDTRVEGTQLIDDPVQYISTLAGELTDWNLPTFPDRGGHPDLTMDGSVISGTYNGDIWITSDTVPERRIFSARMVQHNASWTWDDRWLVVDNPYYEEGATPLVLRGLDVQRSIALVSPDGRAQSVLAYHYSSFARDESTHPAPASSPDGTKVLFDSDMLDPAVGDGGDGDGNPDVWLAVVRPPSKPRSVTTELSGRELVVTWEPPAHTHQELLWNPGNEAREIAGYNVFRSTVSGGPYEQLNDTLLTGTSYIDATVERGIPYYYVVQAVEHSGLASLYSQEAFGSTRARPWVGDLLHFYEAEEAQITLPMVPQLEPRTSSGHWFAGTFAREPDSDFPIEPGPAALTFALDVPVRGRYDLWVKVKGFDAGGNFDVALDGVALEDPLVVLPGDWEWIQIPGQQRWQAGVHTVELTTLDPEIGVDMLALSRQTEPQEPPPFGNGDVVPPAPPSDPRLVAFDGGMKQIVWTPPADKDVAHYNVYCGRDASYPLGNERIVRSPIEPVAFDWGIPTGLATVYKITAVDRYGNESAPIVFDPGVDGEESAPVAVDDLYNIDEDDELLLASIGVLANDIDDDGDTLSAELLTDVSNGILTLDADGGLTYTPDEEYSGEDSFTYRASDGVSYSDVATVTISIAYVDDPPIAYDDAYSTDEDVNLTVAAPLGVLADDFDAEDVTLTALLRQTTQSGDLTLEETGVVRYFPDDDFHGVDTFTYVAWDGVNESNEATVTITVHPVEDLPVAETDEYTVNEDTPLTLPGPGVLANDTDADEDPLQAEIETEPENGSVELLLDGGFTYTPNSNFNGFDAFTYTATDGKGSSEPADVRIVVASVNDPPVAIPDSYATQEDTDIEVLAPGVLSNDFDVDDSNLDAVLESLPQNGDLTLRAGGSFFYQPDTDFAGVDSFQYSVTDGELSSPPVTVTITVIAANDPPEAENDTYFIDEDTVLDLAGPGVLANDFDPDGTELSAELVTGALHGELTLGADGAIHYTPNENYWGDEFLTYVASDGELTSEETQIKISVDKVNDPPVGAPDTFTTPFETVLDVDPPGLLANDSDVDDTGLVAVLDQGVPSGSGTLLLKASGSIRFVPEDGFSGDVTFTYRASDGEADSDPVLVTITVQ